MSTQWFAVAGLGLLAMASHAASPQQMSQCRDFTQKVARTLSNPKDDARVYDELMRIGFDPNANTPVGKTTNHMMWAKSNSPRLDQKELETLGYSHCVSQY